MAWTLGGNRFYVQKHAEATSQIMPRLQPLSGGSQLQVFGYDSTIKTISALVVGDTIKNVFQGYAKDGGTSHALVSPEGSMGNWIVKDFQPNRIPNVCQTIDTSQAEDAPLYDCEFILWQEN